MGIPPSANPANVEPYRITAPWRRQSLPPRRPGSAAQKDPLIFGSPHPPRKDNAVDLLKNYVIQLLMANGLTIALGVAVLAALGVVLGLLKKLVASLFSAALNAGDSAAAQLAAKPKAPLLALLAAALVIPAVWAGYHFSPEKVVEKIRIEKLPPPPPQIVVREIPSAVVAELTAHIAELEAQARRNKDEQARLASAQPQPPVATPVVSNVPSYLDPKLRAERIKAALAKEAERKRKAALAAQEKAAAEWRLAQAKPAPVPPLMTPGQLWDMKMDMQARCRARALADLQKVQQQPQKAPEPTTLIGGLDYERRWR